MKKRRVVALAGGVGAARFLDGLTRVLSPRRIFVIGNTGDDTEMHGLHISPDLDTVTYTLAGLSDSHRGWGLRGDTFHCLASLESLGAETWFQLGDRDLATHLYRTERLRAGETLTAITREIAAALKLRSTIVPMSDDRVRTQVKTRTGEIDFQTYFVKRRAQDPVLGVRWEGAEQAKAAPGVLSAIAEAETVILCPSNPFLSIGPILAVPGIREALREKRDHVIGISPIVGGRALKGPAAHMMQSMGLQPNCTEVAKLYRDLAGVFVLDEVDRGHASMIAALGIRTVVTATIMKGMRERTRLAQVVAREMRIEA
jgi:LPPG:FO 2-phospho-L-lactate transferase